MKTSLSGKNLPKQSILEFSIKVFGDDDGGGGDGLANLKAGLHLTR